MEDVEPHKADPDLGASREAVRTDAEAVQRYQPTNEIAPITLLPFLFEIREEKIGRSSWTD